MGIATYSYNRSTSGGEIITHLVNSTDGQGLDFANGALLQLAYAAGGVFGTADFSIEFIIDQSSANSNDKILYTSGGSSEFQITSETGSSKIELTFDGTDYDFSYDMSADYGSPVHYVMTFDRSALATLYKDGNSVATVDISGSSSVNLDNTGTAAGYLGGTADYGVTGVFYRWRTWKKLLSAAEVTACYENASVPITDQWSNCVTDLDFAFANPEMSLQIQSRSGAGDATASVGISQVTPIEQLNSKSARIGTTAATPADGELVAQKVTVNDTTAGSTWNTIGSFQRGGDEVLAVKSNGDNAILANNDTAGYIGFATGTGAPTRLTIDSAGLAKFSNGIASPSLLNSVDTSLTILGGGSATNNGANLTMYGGSASSGAGSFRFRNGTAITAEIDSTGLATFSSGIQVNGAVGSFASGIYFSGQTGTAATGATTTTSVLNHYEQGTWTPTLLFGGANVSQTGTYVGRYTRVGGVVTVTGRIALTAKGSSTGSVSVGGLPFPSANVANQWSAASLYFTTVSFADYLQAYNYPNEALIHPQEVSNAGVQSALTDANFADASQIVISLVYHV